MKQEADRLIFSRVSVEAGREAGREGGRGGSGELGWGGKGEGVYFTNEDTRAFTYAWTYREETGGNKSHFAWTCIQFDTAELESYSISIDCLYMDG